MGHESSLAKKRRFIITRLNNLSLLPTVKDLMTEDQRKIYDQIWSFDFSYWEQVKIKNGWGITTPKSIEEHILTKKRGEVRTYLRSQGVLPPYGDPLTIEQQKIYDQIENNDFSYKEKFIKEKMLELKLKQQSQTIKKEKTVDTKLPPNKKSCSEPRQVFFRLRLAQILPKIGEELSPHQQLIIDDVYENFLNKPKSFFLKKYIHHSTPEGRMLLKTYLKSHTLGYNFNITIEDIIIPEYCPYLNVKLSVDPNDKDKPFYYSIDRIDNSKGYVKGNVQIISLKANMMKNKSTEQELITFAINNLKIMTNE